jgi:putative ABC transport system substrate-binding protein
MAEPVARPVRLGVLYASTPDRGRVAALVGALRDLGYEQGKNLTLELRDAGGKNENLPQLAAELVSLMPDVLIGSSTPSVLALKKETGSIPLVMIDVGNPNLPGLIESLAHPGGNVTGYSTDAQAWAFKRFQIAKEIFPEVCCFLYLSNPSNPAQLASRPMTERIAQGLGREVKFIDAATPEELDHFMQAPIDERFDKVLMVGVDVLFFTHRAEIAEFALRRGIAMFAPFITDAALISIEADPDEAYRVVASYVDRILKGTKPADLPVQLPTKFVTVINLQTAKALGITIPQSILAQADRVIE